jgi:mannitol/fructose-specific phosphotransferase system IIA component (Ntr-type)
VTSSRSLLPSIQLADVFPREAIVVGLEQRTRQGAVEELVRHLVSGGHIPAEEAVAVVHSIMAREQLLGATGLNGITSPHCRLSFVDRFVGAVGLDPRGLPFESVDGEAVFAFFLLLAPLDRRDQLYEVLGRVMAVGRDKTLRLQLRGCQSAEAVHQFLRSVDRR